MFTERFVQPPDFCVHQIVHYQNLFLDVKSSLSVISQAKAIKKILPLGNQAENINLKHF